MSFISRTVIVGHGADAVKEKDWSSVVRVVSGQWSVVRLRKHHPS